VSSGLPKNIDAGNVSVNRARCADFCREMRGEQW
jgi:hypothetical protein